MSERSLSRRQVLAGTAAGAGVVVLAGCGGGGSTTASPGATDPATPSTAEPSPTPPPVALTALDDVPVGGAVVVQSRLGPVVVAQPSEGEVTGFSAICTHQGCVVGAEGDRLPCPCHGSVFAAATGGVVTGPAERPLPPVAVEVVDGEVFPA